VTPWHGSGHEELGGPCVGPAPDRWCPPGLGAPEDNHQKRVDDVREPAVGPVEPMVVKAAPAIPARPQPKGKGQAIDAGCIDSAASPCPILPPLPGPEIPKRVNERPKKTTA